MEEEECAMNSERPAHRIGALEVSFVLCVLASLVHHVHNAEFLDAYPNLPAWLSPAIVYAAWLGETAVGVAGYIVLRRGWRLAGLGMVAAYAVFGLFGLAHYARAPLSAHTPAMNATILLEAATALLLLAALPRAKHGQRVE
jgi:hypothetical protein